ncbi:MAG TPA: hypothetical protein P5548_00055 [Candidatus Moranbacteria bacterium]|nr:hypothetical protein [Candidatus Moranbacteria bacterium]HRZ33285.1 hypothetical protein [Candidatus Moranbacteria bacterium]
MKKLDSSIYELLGNESVSLLENNLAKSIELGNKGNLFFQLLSRESPCERKFSYLPRYEDENAFLSYIVNMCDFLIAIKDSSVEKIGIDRFNSEANNLLNGTASNYSFPTRDSIENGILRQSRVFNFSRGKDNHALMEIVCIDSFENINVPYSYLFIKNLKNGITIDLSQLLPKKEMCFFPSVISPFEKAETSNEKRFIKIREKQFNLNDYNGAWSMGNDDGFTFHCFNANALRAEAISYGNIVEKGGLLSLLHEIAHSWNPGKDYNKLIDRLVFCLDKRIKQNKSIERILKMLDPFQMADYLMEIEKKAWIDAFHMLLFFRHRDMDLEPEMNNDDVDKHANSRLATYKNFIDSFLRCFMH